MRPRGEIREALASAAAVLAKECGRATWPEIVQRANVGADVGRATVVNMAKAGELTRCGTRPVPGARRPMTLYAPRSWVLHGTGSTLEDVLRSWSRR